MSTKAKQQKKWRVIHESKISQNFIMIHDQATDATEQEMKAWSAEQIGLTREHFRDIQYQAGEDLVTLQVYDPASGKHCWMDVLWFVVNQPKCEECGRFFTSILSTEELECCQQLVCRTCLQ